MLGRTTRAQTPEPDWLAPLQGEPEIKRALAARANGHATPQSVGEQFRRVAADREDVQNLRRASKKAGRKGRRVPRWTCEDEAAVRDCLDAIRAEFGPVRGLVHGAVLMADRRIEDKNDEQFARVYDTKVGGLRAMLRAVGPDDLKALVLFSSLDGPVRADGLRQAYAEAANEVLNKTAQPRGGGGGRRAGSSP